MTKGFLNGFCQAVLANEKENGYGDSVSVEVIEQYGIFYASCFGCVGTGPYSPGDYNNPPEGGERIFGEVEKINLSATWIDCKKDYPAFFSKMQGYFADVMEVSDENENQS